MYYYLKSYYCFHNKLYFIYNVYHSSFTTNYWYKHLVWILLHWHLKSKLNGSFPVAPTITSTGEEWDIFPKNVPFAAKGGNWEWPLILFPIASNGDRREKYIDSPPKVAGAIENNQLNFDSYCQKPLWQNPITHAVLL